MIVLVGPGHILWVVHVPHLHHFLGSGPENPARSLLRTADMADQNLLKDVISEDYCGCAIAAGSRQDQQGPDILRRRLNFVRSALAKKHCQAPQCRLTFAAFAQGPDLSGKTRNFWM